MDKSPKIHQVKCNKYLIFLFLQKSRQIPARTLIVPILIMRAKKIVVAVMTLF